MTGKIFCPYCGTGLRPLVQFLGKRVACGACRRAFICPADLSTANVPAIPAAREVLRSSADADSLLRSPVRPPRTEAATALGTGASLIRCPHCAAALRLSARARGKKVLCSRCRLPFHTKPALPQTPAPPGNGQAGAADVLRVDCPGCGCWMRLRPGLAGFRVRCSRCRHVFRAPAADNPGVSLRSRLLLEVRQTRTQEGQHQASPAPLQAPAPREPEEIRPAIVPVVKETEQAPDPEPAPPPEKDHSLALPEDVELAQLGRLPRRSTKPGRGNYRKVLLGLTLNMTAAAILLGTFVIGLIVVLASAPAIYAATDPLTHPQAAVEPTRPVPLGFLCLGVLVVISEGIHLVGLGYCLGAPRKDSARPLALATLIGGGAGLPLVCGGGGLRLAVSAGLGTALLVFGLLLVCGSKVLYLVFLRALGLALEMRTMARQIYLIISLVLLACLFHLAVLAGSGFGLTADILGVVSGHGTGAGLKDVSVTALLFWFASWLILLYALIRFILTIYEARGHVKYLRACRHELV